MYIYNYQNENQDMTSRHIHYTQKMEDEARGRQSPDKDAFFKIVEYDNAHRSRTPGIT